jgi:rubrerythrin
MLNPRRGAASFGGEALDEIVKNLTHKDFKGKLAIILAGYDSDMDELLSANQGLRSRFSERIKFEDMNDEAIGKMLAAQLKQASEKTLDRKATAILPQLAARLRMAPDFGNGRDVENWSRKVAKRCALSGKSEANGDDLEAALDELLKTKGSVDSSKRGPAPVPMAFPVQTQTQCTHAPPPPVMDTIKTVVQQAAEAQPKTEAATKAKDSREVNPFDGLDGKLLEALQDVLVRKGLNSEAGVQKVAAMSADELSAFADELARRMNVSRETALEQLKKWKDATKTLAALRAKVEAEVKTKKRQAIWRCGVCGRADKPYIACFVAPYIVRYDEVP